MSTYRQLHILRKSERNVIICPGISMNIQNFDIFCDVHSHITNHQPLYIYKLLGWNPFPSWDC